MELRRKRFGSRKRGRRRIKREGCRDSSNDGRSIVSRCTGVRGDWIHCGRSSDWSRLLAGVRGLSDGEEYIFGK